MLLLGEQFALHYDKNVLKLGERGAILLVFGEFYQEFNADFPKILVEIKVHHAFQEGFLFERLDKLHRRVDFLADRFGGRSLDIGARVVLSLELGKNLFGEAFLWVFVARGVGLLVLEMVLGFKRFFGVEEHFVVKIRTFLDI